MATKYELPEEVDDKLLSNLGEEVEMKTFKTNVLPKLECDKDRVLKIKILCEQSLSINSVRSCHGQHFK